MKSKWYLIQGETKLGNYAIIKEESTDLIVAEFQAISKNESNERLINLNSIVSEHNEVIKLLRKN